MNATSNSHQDCWSDAERSTLIEDACALTADQMDEICAVFYAELLQRHPSLRSHFERVAVPQQAARLSSSIRLMLDYIRDPQKLGGVVVSVGVSHIGYGIASAEYAAFVDVLAGVLSRSQARLPPEEARSIWKREFEPIAELMAIITNEK